MSGLPSLPRGRPTQEAKRQYDTEIKAFCDSILKIRSTLDFAVSSRGWCYVLEGENVITKHEFDAAQRVINTCRKSGLLPIEICAVDERREAEGLEDYIDHTSIEKEAADIVESVAHRHKYYQPFGFWEDQSVYIELAVEKIDLRSLFATVVQPYHIPISNIVGWCDINGRAAMMRRFAAHERKGRQCVLLYCGNHDPGGLQISDFLCSNLAELSAGLGWSPDNLIIDRFGLNFDFIKEQGLTWIDNLKTSKKDQYPLDDPRHPDHRKPYVQEYLKRFGARKVEANALVVRPEAGRALCHAAILKYISVDAPDEFNHKQSEAQEQVRLAVIELMARSR
jgi:hypothetical protein